MQAYNAPGEVDFGFTKTKSIGVDYCIEVNVDEGISKIVVAIECKTVVDFNASLNDGRLKKQIEWMLASGANERILWIRGDVNVEIYNFCVKNHLILMCDDMMSLEAFLKSRCMLVESKKVVKVTKAKVKKEREVNAEDLDSATKFLATIFDSEVEWILEHGSILDHFKGDVNVVLRPDNAKKYKDIFVDKTTDLKMKGRELKFVKTADINDPKYFVSALTVSDFLQEYCDLGVKDFIEKYNVKRASYQHFLCLQAKRRVEVEVELDNEFESENIVD